MLAVQVLALIVLIWYAWETKRLRKAAEKQVEVSQELLRAAMDQVEGLSKPCLTLWHGLRDPVDTVLEMGGAVGSTTARSNDGQFVIQNIGNGVALNVKYTFKRINEPDERKVLAGQDRYVPYVLVGQKMTIPEPVAAFSGEYPVILAFQSFGRRKYRTVVTMNNRVLTDLVFEPSTQ